MEYNYAPISTEFIILATLFWAPAFIAIFKNIFWDLYFWQIKEFRWDRFWTHIRWDYTEENRNHAITGFKFIIFSSLVLFTQIPLLAIAAIAITYAFYINESFEFLRSFLYKKIKKPSFKNIRNLIILFSIFVMLIAIVSFITLPFTIYTTATPEFTNDSLSNFLNINNNVYPAYFIYLVIVTMIALLIDLASPLIVTLFVILTAPLSFIRREIKLIQAKKKYNQIKNKVTFIGITGSQGKTTSKEILYNILSQKFKVAKTPENYNTDYGVATSIITQIKKDTEIFIAEIGAYRKGEIKKVAQAFPLDISIVTDVDTQHLGIFGSHEDLFKGKSEIVKYLKDSGISVLNGDNEKCLRMKDLAPGKSILVASEKENFKGIQKIDNTKTTYFFAENIKTTIDKTKFTITNENKDTIKIEIPQTGDHLINTYLTTFAIAKELGMSNDEIIVAFKNMDTKMPRLTFDTGDNDTIVLNDSYNSSFKGFIAAVNLMYKTYKKNKKIVVTKGIYELGKEKKKVYEDLISKIEDKVDVLITTDPLLARLGMHSQKMQTIKAKGKEEMIYYVRESSEKNAVFLLEGRLHPDVVKEIVSDYA